MTAEETPEADDQSGAGEGRHATDRRSFLSAVGAGAVSIALGDRPRSLAAGTRTAASLPWTESFDVDDGATADDGDTAWQLENASAHPGVAVEAGALTARTTNGPARWRSEPIDVSSVDAADLAVTVRGSGNLRAPPDQNLPTVTGENRPTDPDHDGIYEDVDGDGAVDTDDAEALLEHLDDPEVTRAADAYDQNCNDRLDYADVIALGQEARGDGHTNGDCVRVGDHLTVAYVLDGDRTVVERTTDVSSDGQTIEATGLSGTRLVVEITARTQDPETAYHVEEVSVAEPSGSEDGIGQPLEPAVGDDAVYVAGRGKKVQSFARGSSFEDPGWTFTRDGSGSPSRPALDEERGQLYVGGGNGNLYAIDTETGEQNWVYEGDAAITSKPLLKGGDVYVGAGDGTFVRVDADSGEEGATTELDAGIYGKPVTYWDDSRHLFTVTAAGTVYRLRWWDFDVDWKQETGGENIRTSPTRVHKDGFFVATDEVYEFTENQGNLEWAAEYGGTRATTPLYDGRVVVGDDEGTLAALSRPDGEVAWTYDAGSPLTTAPVQDGGRILVTSADGTVHSIAVSDETDVTTVQLEGRRPSSPVVDSSDVYVATEGGGAVERIDRGALDLPRLPSVDAVESTDETDNGDPVYEVRGSSFGSKDQGPAVLYDFVSEAHENGDLNTFHGEFYDDGQDLHTAYPELDRVYDGMSIPEDEQDEYGVDRQDKAPAQYISDEREQANRHDGVDAHYRFRDGSYTGLPMAYGGNHESTDPDMERRYERPENEDQIYVAWWLRPTFGLHSHATFQPESFEGELDFGDSKRDRGERFVIPEGGAGGIDVDGWLVGIRDGEGSSENDDGRVEVEFDTKSNLDRMAGETLIGQETGAKIELPEDDEVLDAEGFTSPNKLLRIWGSGGRTISGAWGPDVVKFEESVWYGTRPDPQEWNLLEAVFDVEEGFLEAWVNFEKRAEFDIDPADLETDNSPTIQLLGMHTGNYGFNTFRVSEIYQDRSIQRVVVADAETLAEASHYELQRPTEWADGRLRFALNEGQLPTDERLYVFVFDDQGQVTETGHPITLPGGE